MFTRVVASDWQGMPTLHMNQDMYIEVVQGVRVESLMAIAAAADAARAAATSAACTAQDTATITAAGDATNAANMTPGDVIESPINTQHTPNDEDRARVQAEVNTNL